MTNDAVATDHEDGALGDVLQPDHVRIDNIVLTDNRLVEVAEQRKVQMLRVGPGLLCEERVDAEPEHLGVYAVQFGCGVPKRAHLLGAGAAERRRKKREDDGPLLQLLAERDRLAILIHQSEIGRLGANVDRHAPLLVGGWWIADSGWWIYSHRRRQD